MLSIIFYFSLVFLSLVDGSPVTTSLSAVRTAQPVAPRSLLTFGVGRRRTVPVRRLTSPTHAFSFFGGPSHHDQNEKSFDDDDYFELEQEMTSPWRPSLVDFSSLAGAIRKGIFMGKQELKFEILYPLVHQQVSMALSEEFLLIQREIAANLPDFPPIPSEPLPRHPKSTGGVTKAKFVLDTEAVKILNGLIKINNAIRHIGRALRHSIIAVLAESLCLESVMPLVDSISEAVINNVDINPVNFQLIFDQKEYKTRTFELIHPAIMKEFDSEDGLDQMLDNYATQFALAGTQAVQNFFIYALQSSPLDPKVIAKIQGNKQKTSHRRSQRRSDVKPVQAAGLPGSVAKYAQSVATALAQLSVETLAALITGLTITYSGFLKHLIRQSLSLPPIRKRILAFFEMNILRGYMPVTRLPKPVCDLNSRLTIDNICADTKTRKERLKILEEKGI